jgi:hypothetical protein
MGMHVARRRPDGSFTFGEEVYRLEDREPDHFAVRRLSDDKVVGSLHFLGDRCEARTEIDGPSDQTDALRGIGDLLAGSRGLLPLQ